MSSRRPKVAVVQEENGRWRAFCNEPGCTWVLKTPEKKIYAHQRAAAHRRLHREKDK